MFIDNVMDKLPYESRMCVYQSFDISIQKYGIPALKEMSPKLSAKITSFILEKKLLKINIKILYSHWHVFLLYYYFLRSISIFIDGLLFIDNFISLLF